MRICGCKDDCVIEWGTCHCGCGATTSLAKQTINARGVIQGQPVPFLKGHAWSKRGDKDKLHVLTDIDTTDRSAQCSRCGLVTIKKDGERWKCTTKHSASHSIVNPDPETKRGWCRACQAEVDLYAYRRGWACKPSRQVMAKTWYEANTEHAREVNQKWRDDNLEYLREYHRAKRYDMKPGDYSKMLEDQDGKCLTCDGDGKTSRGGILHTNHSHTNGAVRGLLCGDCNKAIGLMKDNPEIARRIYEYLTGHAAVKES